MLFFINLRGACRFWWWCGVVNTLPNTQDSSFGMASLEPPSLKKGILGKENNIHTVFLSWRVGVCVCVCLWLFKFFGILANNDYSKCSPRIGCHSEFGSLLPPRCHWEAKRQSVAQAHTRTLRNLKIQSPAESLGSPVFSLPSRKCLPSSKYAPLNRHTSPDTHLVCGSVILDQRQSSGWGGHPLPGVLALEGPSRTCLALITLTRHFSRSQSRSYVQSSHIFDQVPLPS